MSPCPDDERAGCRRSEVPVAGQDPVSLLAILHPARRDPPDADGNTVFDPAGPAVVTTREVDPGAELATSQDRHTLPAASIASATTSLELRTSGSAVVESSAVVSREDRMKQMGFSEKVIDRLNKARATSTQKHY